MGTCSISNKIHSATARVNVLLYCLDPLMLRTALIAALPLALLSACASTTPGGGGNAGSNPTASLAGYHWQLASATDKSCSDISQLHTASGEKPVQLDFADNFSAYAGCNRMAGSYSVQGSTLSIGSLASTLIGCPPALAQRDQTLAALLEKPLTIRSQDSSNLVLVAANGEVLRFAGVPTAETRFGGPGETVFLEVAPERKPCSHGVMANAQCLQVRPVHYNSQSIKQPSSEGFSHFYGEIEGYQHQPGVRNVLRVKRFDIANPPADAPAQAYVLDMVVESENTRL